MYRYRDKRVLSYESKDEMSQSNKIKEIPDVERPYEKCMERGAAALSDAELLAILLRTGIPGENVLDLSRKILYEVGGEGLLSLHQLTMEELMQIKGIGTVKATQIICIAELARRLAKATASESLCFTTAKSVADYYMEDMRHKSQETVKLIMLNTKGKLISEADVSTGTVNASLVSPREIFIEALKKNAVGIIILHNHPSGDPTPSQEDVLLTQRIKKAGELLGVELLDHIVIGNHCYISMNEQKLL